MSETQSVMCCITAQASCLAILLKGKELAEAITKRGHRGATIIEGKGGYTGEISELVICAARSHEIPNIKRMCKEIDPDAFIVMSEANEILGYGFNPPALDD